LAPSAPHIPIAVVAQLLVPALTPSRTPTRVRPQAKNSSTVAATPVQRLSSASTAASDQADPTAPIRPTNRVPTRASTTAPAEAPTITPTFPAQAIGNQASDQSAKAIDLRHGAPMVFDVETGAEVFRCVRCRGMKPISDFPGYSNHKKGYPRSCNRCYAYKHKKPKQEKK